MAHSLKQTLINPKNSCKCCILRSFCMPSTARSFGSWHWRFGRRRCRRTFSIWSLWQPSLRTRFHHGTRRICNPAWLRWRPHWGKWIFIHPTSFKLYFSCHLNLYALCPFKAGLMDEYVIKSNWTIHYLRLCSLFPSCIPLHPMLTMHIRLLQQKNTQLHKPSQQKKCVNKIYAYLSIYIYIYIKQKRTHRLHAQPCITKKADTPLHVCTITDNIYIYIYSIYFKLQRTHRLRAQQYM